MCRANKNKPCLTQGNEQNRPNISHRENQDYPLGKSGLDL